MGRTLDRTSAGPKARARSAAPHGRPAGAGLVAFVRTVAADLRHFSPRRTWTVARLAISEALRLRLLAVVLVGIVAIAVADLTTARFDPVFDTAGSLTHIAEIVITIVGLSLAVFLATYSLPHELSAKTIYSLVTKPVSRLEIIGGKAVGLAVVLGLVTLSLGLLSFLYMEWRGRQVQQLAAARLALRQAQGPEQRQGAERSPAAAAQPVGPPDAMPVALQEIAARGPFHADVYESPSSPLVLVARESAGAGGERTEWLSGYQTHRANWGFAGLPVELVAEGQARVSLRARLPGQSEAGKLSLQEREIWVRLQADPAELGSYPPEWTGAAVLGEDGQAEFSIPGRDNPQRFVYAGGRLWITICGSRAGQSGTVALGVDDDSCTIILPDGRRVPSSSGLKLTGAFSAGKYWIGGQDEGLRLLMGRVRFDERATGRVGRRGAALRVDVAVQTAADIPPQARATITVVNEKTGARKSVAFRPEKRATVLVPLEPEDVSAGGGGGAAPLAVYIQSDQPQVEVGMNNESVRLRVAERPFVLNWLKDLTMLWLSFCVLGAIGTLCGAIAGWQVASLLTAVLYVVANVWLVIIYSVERFAPTIWFSKAAGGVSDTVSLGYRIVFGVLGTVLPNFDRLDYGNTVAEQVNASLSALVGLPHGALWHALLYFLGAVLAGYLLFLRREVAR